MTDERHVEPPATSTRRIELSRALAGCSNCEHDESDGTLVDHCPACRLAVVRLVYQHFADLRFLALEKP